MQYINTLLEMAGATNTGAVRLFFLAVTAAVGAYPDASVGDSDTNTVVKQPFDLDSGKKLSVDEHVAVEGMPVKPSGKEMNARRRVKEILQEAKGDIPIDRSGIAKKKNRSNRNTKRMKRILKSSEATMRNSFQSAIASSFVQNSASDSTTMVVRNGQNKRGGNSWSSTGWNTGWDAGWGWQDPWYDPWGGSTGWNEGSKSSKIGKAKGSSWGGDDWYDDGWWKGDDWLGYNGKSNKAKFDDWSDPGKGDDYHFNDWDKGGWGKDKDTGWGKDKDWDKGWGKDRDWDKGGWGKDKDIGWGKGKEDWGGTWNDWWTHPPTFSPTLSPTFYPTFYPTISPTFTVSLMTSIIHTLNSVVACAF